ncbi:MAG: cytochrome d ubiquinol oxidase subunit II [Deferribacterota bacterium]|nr:cytochrome d ubiquinol oxidase subunit II [Deferribacterota bacterium]
MDATIYQIIWFALWGLLWAVYFMLDGFDLGSGVLHLFLGKNDVERRMIINTLGPVWDGNEVWLVTAGGATFAAFPTTYAYMFSYLYTPLLIILFALIFRGVSFEFRSKIDSDAWRNAWDAIITISSFVAALLFGVAFGNIFMGLPFDDNGYYGSLLSLLNPYGLITGLLFLLLFLLHGSLWLSIKTENELSERAKNLTKTLWSVLFVLAVVFLIATYFYTDLYSNYFNKPIMLIVPLLAVISLVCIRLFMHSSYTYSFFASCLTIITIVFTGVIGLYPNLIPSSIDPAFSLNIYNSSSSTYTLRVMTIVVAIFVPIVIIYQIWCYKVFSKPVSEKDITEAQEEAY